MAKPPDHSVSRVTLSSPQGSPQGNPHGNPQGKPVGKELRRKARRGAQPPPPATAPEHREVAGGVEGVHGSVNSDVHSVLVRLSPEEHQALSAACEALAAVGETVAIEDMIRRVVERWIAATRAAATPEAPAAVPAAPPRAIAAIQTQLRRLAAQPVRRWQALRQALQRWSHALAS
jgi:hypothetical protein